MIIISYVRQIVVFIGLYSTAQRLCNVNEPLVYWDILGYTGVYWDIQNVGMMNCGRVCVSVSVEDPDTFVGFLCNSTFWPSGPIAVS